jgi:hypothetical protein
MINMASMTTTEVASELETDPRTLRKFLRDFYGDGKAVVGKGSRYAIEKRDLRKLRKGFADWTAARAEKVEDEAPAPDEDATDES